MDKSVRAMLACLFMAAVFGLAGLWIVYYRATNERPREHFAIVVDAGSTQTRSSLYRVSVHMPEFVEWKRQVADEHDADQHDQSDRSPAFPLGDFMQVRQVSSCVNGGPLASISSPLDAQNLIKTCLVKFTRQIELLDFVESANSADGTNGDMNLVAADEVSRQLAHTNHRVNSVTHLHLGATAGMRTLEEANQTRAQQKMDWVDDAIGRSNELLADSGGGPHVNKGFVGIIQGSDEALYGWLSVNFVCDTLYVRAPPTSAASNGYNVANNTVYRLSAATDRDSRRFGDNKASPASANQLTTGSIGTLELGGASAQMALQVASNELGSGQINSMSLGEQNLSLFNGHYRLGTRSDLCLGMSQAVLRLTYVLLHTLLTAPEQQQGDQQALFHDQPAEFVNPCLQRGARLELSAKSLAAQWRGACLAPNDKLEPSLVAVDSEFRARVMRLDGFVALVGTGDVEQCDLLLNNLVDPNRCKRYFSLCPRSSNQHGPPEDMQFVTISGYNHALNVLGLVAKPGTAPNKRLDWRQTSATIDEKLGGNSIDYGEFTQKTSEFCSTHSDQLLAKYHKLNKAYQHAVCLQLIYIRKLLVEFYRFDPATSWSQIKFLIFTPKIVPSQISAVQQAGTGAANKHNDPGARCDIGWTLGLILNATSDQIGSDEPSRTIYYHHGASIVFMVRATIVLVLASCFVAIALLLIRVAWLRRAQYRAEASTIHWFCSSSSYDISSLGSSGAAKSPGVSKKPVQRYVLNP